MVGFVMKLTKQKFLSFLRCMFSAFFLVISVIIGINVPEVFIICISVTIVAGVNLWTEIQKFKKL
jgi:hypothetical protein